MPLIKDGNDINIVYEIPENVRTLVTVEFLKEFRKQLFRIHEYYSLADGEFEGILMSTNTSGWEVAFFNACKNTDVLEIYDYSRTLPWYDSDMFSYQISEMMIKSKIILRDMREIIANELGIDYNDIVKCYECGKYFTKDSTIEIEADGENSYICLNCNDMEHKNPCYNTTDYYRESLEELYSHNKIKESEEEVGE